jgi:glycosyltransferase involved in cell wall biosynthesis
MVSDPPRLGLQQRILPAYRAAFFETLAQACPAGLCVFAGQPRLDEAMGPQAKLQRAQFQPTRNRYLLRGGLTLVWQAEVTRWLERWQPGALILEANPRNLSNSHAARWMHTHDGAVIGWGLGAPAFSGPLAGWLEQRRRGYLRQFDALITYSRRGADEFLRCGFPPGRVFVAPNAVTSRPVSIPPQRKPGFESEPAALFVGRLQPRKRVDLLLQACASLPPAQQPRLWIAGDGPARAELESMARQVYPRAEFLGDLRGGPLEEKFQQADVFVLPGTGGLAIQQAMAHALPVIVAEADGTQIDLVRPENGWCVTPGDAEALAQALGQAFSDPSRLRAMGRRSYAIVAEEINIEKMVSVFLEAILSTSAQMKSHR